MQEPSRDQMVSAFDEAAVDFAQLAEHLWDPISQAAVVTAVPAPEERVLDACCGIGSSALPTARRVGRRGLVDAVDISAPLVDALRQASANAPTRMPQLHPHCADVTVWPSTGYDLVQSVLGIFFLPDLTADSRRLAERARPGGRVAFTIWRGEAMAQAGRACAEAVQDVLATRWPEHRPSPVESINNHDDFAAWLRNLGLINVTLTTNPHTLELTDRLAWLVILGSGFRAMLANLDPQQITDVHDSYLQRISGQRVDATTLTAVGHRPH